MSSESSVIVVDGPVPLSPVDGSGSLLEEAFTVKVDDKVFTFSAL